MSPAGKVTGSMKEKGSLDPGGGLRNWGLRGTPLERVGSTAKKRRINSQTPVDWTVYFYSRALAIRSMSWGVVGIWGCKVARRAYFANAHAAARLCSFGYGLR
jgi:hypothetical protein